ncbi:MAG: methylated-DNA--[protein]-cysteine S-methyltransferase [Rikenellaceae bacterium]
MNVNFAIYNSVIGYIHIEHRDERLIKLQILKDRPADFGCADNFTDALFCQITEYLLSQRKTFDVDIDLSDCTPFQKRVLMELLNIPYGETRSYKQIAEAVGNSKASRAVGMANNRNPIHIIIPCHRVISSKGTLTGYAAGLDIKELLLNLEK